MTCSNNIKCPTGSSSFQSNFTFGQNELDPWSPNWANQQDVLVPQEQDIAIANCARFSLTSDGTSDGTKIDVGDMTGDQTCPRVQKTPIALAEGAPMGTSSSSGRLHVVATSKPRLQESSKSTRTSTSMSTLFLAGILTLLLFTPGIHASPGNPSRGRAELRIRAVSDKVKTFAQDFSADLANIVNDPGGNEEDFTHNLVASIVSSVCNGYFQGDRPSQFSSTIIQDCVKSVYGGEQATLPAEQFLAVFGASLLCNYIVSEAYPVAQEFYANGCEGLQELVVVSSTTSAMAVANTTPTRSPITGPLSGSLSEVTRYSKNTAEFSATSAVASLKMTSNTSPTVASPTGDPSQTARFFENTVGSSTTSILSIAESSTSVSVPRLATSASTSPNLVSAPTSSNVQLLSDGAAQRLGEQPQPFESLTEVISLASRTNTAMTIPILVNALSRASSQPPEPLFITSSLGLAQSTKGSTTMTNLDNPARSTPSASLETPPIAEILTDPSLSTSGYLTQTPKSQSSNVAMSSSSPPPSQTSIAPTLSDTMSGDNSLDKTILLEQFATSISGSLHTSPSELNSITPSARTTPPQLDIVALNMPNSSTIYPPPTLPSNVSTQKAIQASILPIMGPVLQSIASLLPCSSSNVSNSNQEAIQSPLIRPLPTAVSSSHSSELELNSSYVSTKVLSSSMTSLSAGNLAIAPATSSPVSDDNTARPTLDRNVSTLASYATIQQLAQGVSQSRAEVLSSMLIKSSTSSRVLGSKLLSTSSHHTTHNGKSSPLFSSSSATAAEQVTEVQTVGVTTVVVVVQSGAGVTTSSEHASTTHMTSQTKRPLTKTRVDGAGGYIAKGFNGVW